MESAMSQIAALEKAVEKAVSRLDKKVTDCIYTSLKDVRLAKVWVSFLTIPHSLNAGH
jgi:hypothetical protein